jgi:hypothetical protein
MDAIQRFEQAHQNMAGGRAIPERVLQDYVQTIRLARATRLSGGMFGKTITIGQVTGAVLANEGLLRAAIESGWDVRVSGQKF